MNEEKGDMFHLESSQQNHGNEETRRRGTYEGYRLNNLVRTISGELKVVGPALLAKMIESGQVDGTNWPFEHDE